MKNLISGEIYKMIHAKATYVIGIVLLLLTALQTGVAIYVNQNHPAYGVDNNGIQCMLNSTAGSTTLFILFGIFVSILIAADYSTGSIRQVVAKGFSRPKIVLGKYIAFVITCFVLLVLYMLLNFVGGCIAGGPGSFTANAWHLIACQWLGAFCMVAGYIPVALFVTYLCKSSGLAVAINCIILVAGNIGITALTMLKPNFKLVNYWVVNLLLSFGNNQYTYSQQYINMGVFLLMGVVFTVGSIVWFSNRDVA